MLLTIESTPTKILSKIILNRMLSGIEQRLQLLKKTAPDTFIAFKTAFDSLQREYVLNTARVRM
jgi:hypothetical protein